jgi:glycosyltransferase involved in cell wall biosynthesis
VERKGLLPFLKVLCDWANGHLDTNLEFWLAGNGPLRPQIESLPTPKNLVVRCCGDVPYQYLPRLYAQADLFVFPTLADEWGIVVSEALAAGVPVLGSAYSQAVEELIHAGRNGWIFYPDYPRSTASVLNVALNTRLEQLMAMREAAQVSAQKLSPPIVAKCFLTAITQITQVGMGTGRCNPC